MKWSSLILLFILFISDSKAQKSTSSQSLKSGVIINDPIQIEKLPRFPGGQKALNRFLNRNLKWPDPGVDAQGKVIIGFIIEKDGKLTNFKVERSMGKPFDDEALRVVRKSPKWIPGKQNGKPVRVRYSLPINFIIHS